MITKITLKNKFKSLFKNYQNEKTRKFVSALGTYA